jgi:uncharacterized membrane protein YphA (DoxX/SURF4 family)
MSWLGQNIVLGWGPTLVRLAAGGFFLPHVYAKLFGPGTIVFFQAAGFKPPACWMYLACAIETAVACSLLSNVLVRYFGILGAVHLLVAAAAVYIVSRGNSYPAAPSGWNWWCLAGRWRSRCLFRARVRSRGGDGNGYEAEKCCKTNRPHSPTFVGISAGAAAPQPLCRITCQRKSLVKRGRARENTVSGSAPVMVAK